MAEDQNNKENTTTSDTNNTSEYEDVCYICRRPESVAGKMIHIQNDICICQDCMQKTFDTMNNGTFNMGDFMNMNMGKMPNISMINLADLQNAVPNKQKVKKKKPKDEQPKPELDIHSIEQPIRAGQIEEMARLVKETPIPIALDEELIGVTSLKSKAELLDKINPQYIILKPSLHGGICGSTEWSDEAVKRNIGW